MDTLAEQPTPYVSKYPPRDPNKPRRKRINLALAGALISQGMSFDDVAPQVGAATGNCLRVTMQKKGLNATDLRLPEATPEGKRLAQVQVTRSVIAEASAVLKDKLEGRLVSQIASLSKRKVGSLANRGQGEAAVLKTMAETWRTLNGNPDSITVQFGANLLSDFTPTPPPVVSGVPVIDVSEATTTQPVQQPDSV